MSKTIVIGICAASLSGGAFAYGVDIRAALRHEVESTCVPINSALFRMCQPDGVERIFVRDRDEPNLLRCTVKPWLGAIRPERRMINVFTSPEFKGEKTEFCFVDGRLRFMSVGTKDYEFNPSDYAAPTNSVESLWPAAELTEKEKSANDMWRGSGRLRLFSNNPNRAALVFVQIALVALAIAFFAGSRMWRLHGLVWSLIATLLMFQSQSRGGFLAFLVGLAALLLFRLRRGVGCRFLMVLSVGMVLVLAFALVTNTASRVTEGTVRISNDRSSQSRLFIWREVPRMIAAAPFGWGLWKSGPAYNSWFEKQGNMHMIGDLFNDHLSRMVEGGFVMGGLYVFVWALLFAWTLRLAWRGGPPLPLAVCAAYFVASSFNPMNWWTPGFYLPVAVLVWGAWRMLPDKLTVICAGGVTAVVLAGVAAVALLAPEQDVPLKVGWLGRRVIVGEGDPKVWLVDDGFVLSGDYYGFPGREIRTYYRDHAGVEPMGIVTDLSDLPNGVDRLVVTGRSCVPYLQDPRVLAKHVILLTPPFGGDTIYDTNSNKVKEKFEKADLHILTGEHVARLTGDDRRKNPRVHVYLGVAAYVPGWLGIVLRKSK